MHFKKNVHEFIPSKKKTFLILYIYMVDDIRGYFVHQLFLRFVCKINTLIVVVACIRLLRWWWSAGIHRLTTAQQSVGGCCSQKTPGFGCLLSWNKALILHTQKHQSPILMKKSSQFVNTFSYHSPSYPDWS